MISPSAATTGLGDASHHIAPHESGKPDSSSHNLSPRRQRLEYLKCDKDPAYFIYNYCQIEDPTPPIRSWFPFKLWPAQFEVLDEVQDHRQIIILKARQLGLTWLIVAYGLWMMIFRPGTVILTFSMTDKEAMKLVNRFKEMHARLPSFLQASLGKNNDHEMEFAHLRSRVRAFPSTKRAGRSFTASLVIIDEADFLQWIDSLLTAVKPTIDAGGQMVLISTADKERPETMFKQLYLDATRGDNNYHPIFLPWHARPDRDDEWRAAKIADMKQDDLWQEYPATDTQALAARQESKRFQAEHLDQCFSPTDPIEGAGPPIPGLVVYDRPAGVNHSYLISVDTSEGDPTSDASPAIVFETETWKEVACLYGTFEPEALAGYVVLLANYYQGATIGVERNNHGHAVHVALKERSDYHRITVYKSPHDRKLGWYSSPKFKTLAVDHAATAFKAGDPIIRTDAIRLELADFEAATLKAPEGRTDDLAMAYINGLAMLRWPTLRRDAGAGTVSAN